MPQFGTVPTSGNFLKTHLMLNTKFDSNLCFCSTLEISFEAKHEIEMAIKFFAELSFNTFDVYSSYICVMIFLILN